MVDHPARQIEAAVYRSNTCFSTAATVARRRRIMVGICSLSRDDARVRRCPGSLICSAPQPAETMAFRPQPRGRHHAAAPVRWAGSWRAHGRAQRRLHGRVRTG